MKVTCPSCGHASQVDEGKIPEKGVQTKCRKCNARFLLDRTGAVGAPDAKPPSGKARTSVAPIDPPASPAPPPVPDSSEPAVYICEKCRHKQHPSRACVYCGNPFPQFQEPSPDVPEKERAAKPKPAGSDKKEPERITPKPAIYPISASEGAEEAPGVIPCPFCDEPIREKAKKCKHCGEFIDRQERAAAGAPIRLGEVFSGLIDFRFTRMITPELVKAFYIAALILGGLVALALMFFAVRSGAYGAAAGSLIGYLLAVLFSRVYAELSIIVFKIEENTRRSRR